MTDNAHILVVDDDPRFAEMVGSFIRRCGFRTTLTHNGRQGLDAFRSGGFQTALIDLAMPDLDGIDLLAAMRKVDRRVPVIIVTGHGTIEKAIEATRKGAYDFIAKPVDLGTLEIKIRQAVGRHVMLQRLSLFQSLTVALLFSIPLWLLLGVLVARML